MQKVKVRVNAKINLTLDVVGEFGGGYHNLDMVMASVGIFDILECEVADKISVIMDGKECDEGNTAFKVAKICNEEFACKPVAINIVKGIPFGGGLGGSSADASAALYCMQKLFGLSEDNMLSVAKRVGSDVTFMLKGGIMRAGGKGDDLQALPFKEYSLVIAKGKQSASTKEVFDKFDQIGEVTSYTEEFVRRLSVGENELECVGNGLQPASSAIIPEITQVVKALQKYSHYVSMSGSGSSVFAIVENMADANALADLLKTRFNYVKACTSLPYGVKEL